MTTELRGEEGKAEEVGHSLSRAGHSWGRKEEGQRLAKVTCSYFKRDCLVGDERKVQVWWM